MILNQIVYLCGYHYHNLFFVAIFCNCIIQRFYLSLILQDWRQDMLLRKPEIFVWKMRYVSGKFQILETQKFKNITQVYLLKLQVISFLSPLFCLLQVSLYQSVYIYIYIYKWERKEAETGNLFRFFISCRLSWHYSFRERGIWTSSLQCLLSAKSSYINKLAAFSYRFVQVCMIFLCTSGPVQFTFSTKINHTWANQF